MTTTLVTLRDPLSLPWSNLAVEIVVIGLCAASLVHAIRGYRGDKPYRLFTWFAVFFYGIIMDLSATFIVDNFLHAQFTVAFVNARLPLYIIAVYPFLIYTAVMLIDRFNLPLWALPFATGLTIVLFDFPYDIVGPDAGWWTWSDKDPNLAYRWHGVPVTSYYWHLGFGGVLALLCRLLRGRVQRIWANRDDRRRAWLTVLGVALGVGAVTPALGVVTFLPFHILKKIGVADGIIVAGLFACAGVITVVAPKTISDEKDRLLLALPLVHAAFYLALVAIFWVSDANFADQGAKAAVISGALALLCGATIWARPDCDHARDTQSTP